MLIHLDLVLALCGCMESVFSSFEERGFRVAPRQPAFATGTFTGACARLLVGQRLRRR